MFGYEDLARSSDETVVVTREELYGITVHLPEILDVVLRSAQTLDRSYPVDRQRAISLPVWEVARLRKAGL